MFVKNVLPKIGQNIKKCPVLFQSLLINTIHKTFNNVTKDDMYFLYCIGQYVPNRVHIRAIADLDREYFSICTKFNRYHKTFFKDGRLGDGFLD